MKPSKNETLEFFTNILDDDNEGPARKLFLENFIQMATTKPEDVEPELIYFVGKLLENLKNKGYEEARKNLRIPSLREDNKTINMNEKIQLISDVNYLFKYSGFKGAQGALGELLNNSPYYKEYANLNSLGVTYRKAIKDMTEWFSPAEKVSQELEGLEGAIKGKVLMKYLHIIVTERDPLI